MSVFDKAKIAERTRRVLLDGLRYAQECRAAGIEPVSLVDKAIERAAEERQWRAVWADSKAVR